MSSAAAAKTSRTQSEGAQAQPRTSRWPGTETTRGWSPPSAPPRLQMGRPDDASEAEADSLARRVLSGPPGSARPILAARPPAQPEIHARAEPGQSVAAPAGLENRISSAASEGRPMPQDQRGFFEPRFGHDFSAVRIHDGPASAAAARSAGAQAFTFGRDIYFGAGHYQPHIAQGRDLMAHELAHTVQARSHVIARRALPGPDVAGADQTPEAGPERPGAKPAAGDLHEAMQAGEASTSDRLAGLDPEAKAEALGRLRARLPAGETDKAVKLDRPLAENGKGTLPPQPDRKAGTAGVTQGERERGVEVRALPSAPAPVQQKSAVAPANATPVHEQASASAAAKMQEAVSAVTGGPDLAGITGPLDVAPAAAAGSPAGGKPAADGAAAAAQDAVAALNSSRAGLQNVQSLPVIFQQEADGSPGDPEAAARERESGSMARSFVKSVSGKVENLIGAALTVPAAAMTALASARQAIEGQITTQSGAVKSGANKARKGIQVRTAQVRSAIASQRSATDQAAEAGAKTARDRAGAARDNAGKTIGKRAETEKARITKSYGDAVAPMSAVGNVAGGKAVSAATALQSRLLDQKDGESSILDGPIHDDRLEARGEAAVKVGEEYAKSLVASADEQAGKLHESRADIVGKVSEITGQAEKGLTAQLEQINQGAGAHAKGAAAHSRLSALKMTAAAESSSKQAVAELDAAADQQASALAAEGQAAQAALDQATAAGLASFAGGVTRTSNELAVSIGSFIGSTAQMPVPERGELSAALGDAGASADTTIAAMAGQVLSVGPALQGTSDAGQERSGKSLAAAAAVAQQGFDRSVAGFAQGAAAIGQQAAQGFKHLATGNQQTADGIGADAEAGFKQAEKNAGDAYGQFGDMVEANFATGRGQMLDGLWGSKTQAQLQKDMAEQGDKAEAEVKPRWKRVLKWVITIVIVLAVIAITILSAGSLGPVGIILLGAALGAAAGAVQTIANNLIDDKPWHEGVVRAMVVGAIGGALGGAGGVLLKGVGSVAVRVALDAGVGAVSGFVSEVGASLILGETINWTNAAMSALVGMGVGLGLGIAGAAKGRIKIPGFGKPSAALAPHPVIEAPPPAPAGRLRSLLEQTKILAPRPGAAIPEISIGGTGEAPAPAATAPKQPIGFRMPGEPAPAPAAMGELATPAPRRLIGYNRGEAPAPSSTPARVGSTTGGPVDFTPAQAPRAMVFEPAAPRAGSGGMKPAPAGGRSSLEVRASSEPGGGGARPGGPHQAGEPVTRPMKPLAAPEPAEVTPARKTHETRMTPEPAAAKAPSGKAHVPESPMPGENLPAGQKPAGKPRGSQPAAGEQTGKTAGGKKSAGTNEPQKAETGNQKEARELGSDRPQRPAKGADYFDYEGGKRGSFRSFFKKASKHFEGLEKSGQIAKGPHTDPKVLDMNAEEFIRSKPNLRQQWDSMSEKIEERMAAIRKNSSNYSRDPRYKELGELNDELAKFGRGKLGEKRPDLVELLLKRDKVVVTDITQKSGDAFHEFKTKVYKNLLQDLFPALEAEGVEYKGPSAQEIF